MRIEERLLIKNLAKTADMVNTINGGMSQAKLKVTRNDEKWLVRLKVPGVGPDQLKIEIKDNQMFIFQIMDSDNSSDIQLPYLITSFVIGGRIDYEGIKAEYDDGEVLVHMPVDEFNNGREREIEIIKR